MKTTIEALCWAMMIIIVAFVMKQNGMSEGAAMGVTMGLIGAAIATMKHDDKACGS